MPRRNTVFREKEVAPPAHAEGTAGTDPLGAANPTMEAESVEGEAVEVVEAEPAETEAEPVEERPSQRKAKLSPPRKRRRRISDGSTGEFCGRPLSGGRCA